MKHARYAPCHDFPRRGGNSRKSLILNLPGSPKSVRENLAVVLPALKHAIEKIKGDDSECAVP